MKSVPTSVSSLFFASGYDCHVRSHPTLRQAVPTTLRSHPGEFNHENPNKPFLPYVLSVGHFVTARKATTAILSTFNFLAMAVTEWQIPKSHSFSVSSLTITIASYLGDKIRWGRAEQASILSLHISNARQFLFPSKWTCLWFPLQHVSACMHTSSNILSQISEDLNHKSSLYKVRIQAQWQALYRHFLTRATL